MTQNQLIFGAKNNLITLFVALITPRATNKTFRVVCVILFREYKWENFYNFFVTKMK